MHNNPLNIESRVQLFNTLAEAAELEHNLLCCYLYALFSLKHSVNEGVTEEELKSINSWRDTIRGIALEEMTHLTLVANLMSAIGGSPHFMRPNLPTPSGPYPADIVIELAPFDLKTIQHFVYLERPDGTNVEDGETFKNNSSYVREAPKGRLMPNGGNYNTVGELYRDIRQSIENLVEELGEEILFVGSPSLQISPLDSPLPGLTAVKDLETAKKALDTIVTQGEGAIICNNSHFERFSNIEKEYKEILAKNPNFIPARSAARNPVMRKPPTPEGKVWCNGPLTSLHMDLANAVYVSSVRLLVQAYQNRNRDALSKKALLNASFSLMRAMTPLGESLTYLPSNDITPHINAGMSFAVVRSLAPLQDISEKITLIERSNQIILAYNNLVEETKKYIEINKNSEQISNGLIQLLKAEALLKSSHQALLDLKPPTNETTHNVIQNPKPSQPEILAPVVKHKIEGLPYGEGIEQVKGKNISISFDSKKCIHSRHCVTELPKVFVGNTKGEWLFPDKASAEMLASVARECPSGAIQYIRHDQADNETAPESNLIHLRENGPYALLADIKLADQPANFRATLCRCGQSANKPFCDGAHNKAKFKATGEPDSLDTTPLETRNGELHVDPLKNGPLHITGNLELCAGTGRSVLKTTDVKLCRCGNSQAKPLCDGSHLAAGFKADGV